MQRSLAALLATVIVTAACATSNEADDTTTTTTGGVTTTLDEPEQVPSMGRFFAYVGDLRDGVAQIDPARFLSGEEANIAARRDGVIGEGESVPNDFYIDNDDTRLFDVAIPDTATVRLLSATDLLPTEVGVDELEALFEGSLSPMEYYGFASPMPMWLTMEDGAVVTVEAQYLP